MLTHNVHARDAFTAAPMTGNSACADTISNTLPCSGDIVTISCKYWLNRLILTKRASGPQIKNLPGPSI